MRILVFLFLSFGAAPDVRGASMSATASAVIVDGVGVKTSITGSTQAALINPASSLFWVSYLAATPPAFMPVSTEPGDMNAPATVYNFP